MEQGEEERIVKSLIAQALALNDEVEAQDEIVRQIRRHPVLVVHGACSRLLASGKGKEAALACAVLSQLPVPDRQIGEQIRAEVADKLRSDSDEVVASAVHAFYHLGIEGTEGVLSRILSLSESPDEQVRIAVAVALGGNSRPEVLEALVRLSDDGCEEVRNWATFGLGIQTDVDTPAIRDALRRRVGDTHRETRHEAILGLARRGDAAIADVIGDELAQGRFSVPLLEAVELIPRAEWLPILETLHQARPEWSVVSDALSACKPEEMRREEDKAD